ncbi:UDP-2,4-diacetamido-2,4,6-trideoxy-beta-L-altropyranose hydrolase [Caulobacter sp. UNC279MFTsu5.1]|uniref:UDP-2,4-diacetamido-2,4, 6-trideoxy-beta-L-altropyranose hydrolase n=1 Tax=Caulobacter sp. UNC279MFTsu5.1 TaxID=1502775 RepID=UPI0008E0FD4D|nr:UDP-2,4-diacetamido-2,4,6-trideoxy-beta-L-altropyranose hydrolase [Caulobacter sp. UNC279MFTsu5.1]SFI73124.1 UDP-2,4-diacetamido-2,4,6-trideoxy-beta-L-altropyranose hydrolase [Caulobacter sp. UNC279MFTsu5.1]
MTPFPRILFVADAGPRVGGGHVMRSLTLARALEDAGATCAFVAPPAAAALLDAFGAGVARIETGADTPAALVEAAANATGTYDAVVIDHYGLSAPDHRAIAAGRPALVIDDLADRPLAADLVLDSGPARAAADYDGLVPAQVELLLGPNHAPVRPAFAALRREALARRAGAPPVRRILVSLGLTDVGGITAQVVDLILPRLKKNGAGQTVLDVVLGSGAPSLPRLRALAARDPRLVLHIDSQDMPRLTLEADLAVGAGGSSTWERCVLALPTLLLVLAANQGEASQALARADAVLTLDVADPDFEAAFAAQLSRLLGDPSLRDRLSAASAAVCDGRGAARVAAHFLEVIARKRAG